MARRATKWWTGLVAAAALTAMSGEASALLWENETTEDDPEGVVLVYFYPYRSVLLTADPGYTFDDDPLTALVHTPYDRPVHVPRVHVARTLVKPRTSFVGEMTRSCDLL